MKRLQLIAAALCLVMLATVGAGAVAAQEENPRQAGSSHIYLYDVTATDTNGKGKLQINVDKHTFEFNGQGFPPSQSIDLKARAVGGTDYVAFATGKTTPSGNLHLAGTWEKDAAPADVVGEVVALTYQGGITAMWLTNNGIFVSKLACYYSTDDGATWTESRHTDGIHGLGGSGYSRLADLGVPNGAWVRIHVIVVGGKDRTGSEVFQAKHGYPGDWWYADYWITGATWNPTLTYHGIYGNNY